MDTMVSSIVLALMVACHTRRYINNSIDTCMNRSGSKYIDETGLAKLANIEHFGKKYIFQR